jgi:hypothetical protein
VACSIEENRRFFSIAARRIDRILRSLWFLLNFVALTNIPCIANYLLTYLNAVQ